MTWTHIVLSAEALRPGESAITVCGKEIRNVHFTGFIDQDVTCPDCRIAVWNGRIVTPVMEAEEFEQLKAKGRIS